VNFDTTGRETFDGVRFGIAISVLFSFHGVYMGLPGHCVYHRIYTDYFTVSPQTMVDSVQVYVPLAMIVPGWCVKRIL